MRTRRPIAIATIVATVLVLGPLAAPAGASVAAATSGTVLTVTMTGDGSAEFQCEGGTVAVNHVQAAPALNCAALTQVTVVGDAGNQSVYGDQLTDPAFSALPKLVATMGDGSDDVRETDRADQLDLGPGDDYLELRANGLANSSANLGTGSNDGVTYTGTSLDDAINVSSSTATSATITDVVNSVLSVQPFTNAEAVVVSSLAGDDTIDATGVTASSGLTQQSYSGGAGDDEIRAGAKATTMDGDDGTNLLVGGPATDGMHASGAADTIDPGADAVLDFVYDEDSLASGGRTYTHLGTADVWALQASTGDVVARARPSGGALLWTTSLTRTGQQLLPTTLGTATGSFGFFGRPAHQALFDAVATPVKESGAALASDHLIADFTVPTGSWTVNTYPDTVEVVPTSAGLAKMAATNADDYRVHGPWTNKDKGFVHRATRDLLFQFATDAARDATATKLTNHTTTRAAVTASLMNTDEYRGLDVDRVFVAYLRRAADPGGRTSWITAIRNGKALWRFRAQVLGSNEYYDDAGGTNEQYLVAAYRDVLGREPDPSGKAHWTAALDSGADRGQIALKFINAAEEKRSVINEQFLRFLDRTATTAELNTWVPRMSGVTGEQDLVAFLANSNAYYTRD